MPGQQVKLDFEGLSGRMPVRVSKLTDEDRTFHMNAGFVNNVFLYGEDPSTAIYPRCTFLGKTTEEKWSHKQLKCLKAQCPVLQLPGRGGDFLLEPAPDQVGPIFFDSKEEGATATVACVTKPLYILYRCTSLAAGLCDSLDSTATYAADDSNLLKW